MPGTPDSGELQQRYDVIEKAYCQGRWSLVIETGTALLRDLSELGDEPRGTALFHRTQLLIAHTLLHGYGDRDAAEDVYQAVRQSGAEPSLRQIAEEGLDQCHQPLPSSLAEEEPEPEAGVAMATRPLLFLPEDERSDVREHEAPLGPSKAGAGLSYQPREQRSSATAPPTPAVRTSTPPAAPEDFKQAERASRGEAAGRGESGSVDLGLAADPFRASSGQPPAPAVGAEALVMPWLAGAPSAAPAPETAEPEPLWQRPAATIAQPGALALVPDVVEEPELMEVHQASPSLAEEVDVVIQASASGSAHSRAEGDGDPDRDLMSCLLRVRVD